MKPYNSLPEWLLEKLLKLDQLAEGLLRESLSAGPARQQAIAAAFALATPSQLECSDYAKTIAHSKTRDILPSVCPDLPSSFYQLVTNPRFGILQHVFYKNLAHWLENNSCPRALKALRHGPNLSSRILNIIEILDPLAVSPRVLNILPDVASARALNNQLKILRQLVPEITDKELYQATRTMAKESEKCLAEVMASEDYIEQPQSLLMRFRDRLIFPEAPLCQHPNLLPLSTPKELHRAGRLLQNCARQLIESVAFDDCYYYLWQPDASDQPTALVRLRRAGCMWRYEDSLGKRNEKLNDKENAALIKDFEQAGAINGEDWPLDIWTEFSLYDAKKFRHEWTAATNPTGE